MCYQKRKISEHLENLYRILCEKRYIKSSFFEFQAKWSNGAYQRGVRVLAIDILYAVIMQNNDRIVGIRDRIRNDFLGNIPAFLNADQYIVGKVKKTTSGIAGFAWEMLEKLNNNDMQYFENLYKKITSNKQTN
jgi:transcription termination factor NusB